MPYYPSEETSLVTVERVELTLASDKRWAKVAEAIMLTGRLTRDGLGYGGQPVYIQYRWTDGAWYETGPYFTDGNGNFSVEARYDYDWGCTDLPRRARWESLVSGEVMVAVAFPTRVSISAPSRVTPGQAFTVTGVLEYEEAAGLWRPLAGQPLSVLYDTVTIGTVNTGADGSYSVTGSIPTSGVFGLKALFGGSGIPMVFAPSWAVWPAEIPDWAESVLDGLKLASPFIVVGGLVAYNELSKGTVIKRWW